LFIISAYLLSLAIDWMLLFGFFPTQVKISRLVDNFFRSNFTNFASFVELFLSL